MVLKYSNLALKGWVRTVHNEQQNSEIAALHLGYPRGLGKPWSSGCSTTSPDSPGSQDDYLPCLEKHLLLLEMVTQPASNAPKNGVVRGCQHWLWSGTREMAKVGGKRFKLQNWVIAHSRAKQKFKASPLKAIFFGIFCSLVAILATPCTQFIPPCCRKFEVATFFWGPWSPPFRLFQRYFLNITAVM